MFRTRQLRLAHIVATTALLLTAGCAVGPNFKKPAAPDVGGYTPLRRFRPPAAPPTSPGERRNTLIEGTGHSGGMVGVVPLEAAQRFD